MSDGRGTVTQDMAWCFGAIDHPTIHGPRQHPSSRRARFANDIVCSDRNVEHCLPARRRSTPPARNVCAEAVILGVDGISDFNALHSRRHDYEVQLYAFDCLAYDGDDLKAHWRLTTRREQTADEYGILVRSLFAASSIDVGQIVGIALASVVPPLTSVVVTLCRTYLGHEPLVIEPGVKTGMPILYEPPSDVGADRIVNGVAASPGIPTGGAARAFVGCSAAKPNSEMHAKTAQ